MKVVFFPTPGGFQSWREESHQRCQELWAGFYKKSSGKSSITYPEAVDEALCFGWIDGVRKKVNDDAYTVRFIPCNPKSQWSTVNIRKARSLPTKAGCVSRPSEPLKGAKDQPRNYSYAQRKEPSSYQEHERRFRANRKAWDLIQLQPPWYRRTRNFLGSERQTGRNPAKKASHSNSRLPPG